MIRWLALLLLLLTAAGSFFPCCSEDDCLDQLSVTEDHRQEHEDKGSCSPFFSCGTCTAAIAIMHFPELTFPVFSWRNAPHSFYQMQLSSYHPTLFQPPRLG